MAEKATTPAQSAAVANFLEPIVVIPEFSGGSGTAASVNATTANISIAHTTLFKCKSVNIYFSAHYLEYNGKYILRDFLKKKVAVDFLII